MLSDQDKKLSTAGLPMALLLLAFYNNAKQQSKAYENMRASRIIGLLMKPGSLDLAEAAVTKGEKIENLNFNYVNLGAGERVIKINFNETYPDFTQYDYHHGEGKAKEILQNLKAEYIAYLTEIQKKNPSHIVGSLIEFLIVNGIESESSIKNRSKL